MKIAIISQSIDSILPPFQSSVGACTYGLARAMAPSCKVRVYGREKNLNRWASPEYTEDFSKEGVHYRFVSTPVYDQWLTKGVKFFWRYVPFSAMFNRGMRAPASASRWQHRAYGRKVALELSQEPWDIIHVQHSPQYLPILRRLNPKAKIVLHLHAELFPQCNPAMLSSWFRHLDLLMSVSNYITEKTRLDFPEFADRCLTTYNGIISEEFEREKNYSELKHREIKRIMFAGGVSPHKGVHVLLDAFKIVVKRYPNVQLEVFGPPGAYFLEETWPLNQKQLIASLAPFYSEDYVTLLKQKLTPDIASKVAIPGAIPRQDLVNNYFNADIFVFPSLWDEGFGIPPVEAMAAGTPVVATRSGGVVETVQDGITGLIVEKNDAPALAAAILRLLENDDLREAMGKAGRKRVFELFTWERVAERLLPCYQTLCESGR